MEAQEKKANDILQRELGYVYHGETYEQLKEYGFVGYSKVCIKLKHRFFFVCIGHTPRADFRQPN